jgi:hypothetical protein
LPISRSWPVNEPSEIAGIGALEEPYDLEVDRNTTYYLDIEVLDEDGNLHTIELNTPWDGVTLVDGTTLAINGSAVPTDSIYSCVVAVTATDPGGLEHLVELHITAVAATAVVPDPMNGSMTSMPRLMPCSMMHLRGSSNGNTHGWPRASWTVG